MIDFGTAVQVIFRLFHEACVNWIVVNVANLLCGKGRAVAFFGLVILPPELISRVSTGRFSCLLKDAEHPVFAAFLFILLNGCYDLSGCKFFKVAKDIGKVAVFGGCQQVHMVAHDAPGVKFETFLLLTMPKAINEDITVGFAGKDVYPSTTAKVMK